MTPLRLPWRRCLVALVLPTGCYYFSAQEQINQADLGLEELVRAGAEQSAPYEYHLAREYLHRARIENNESDFASARDFAMKSLTHVRRGLEALPAPAASGLAPDAGGWPSEAGAGTEPAAGGWPADAEPAPPETSGWPSEAPAADGWPADATPAPSADVELPVPPPPVDAELPPPPVPGDPDGMAPDLVIVPEDVTDPADLEAEPVVP